MRIFTLGAFLALVVLSTGYAQQPAAATADVRDRLSRFIGTAVFREEQGGVRITGTLRNLAPGPHGMHIHSVAQCLSPTYASAGPIFNPTGKRHGLRNPAGPQVGDLAALVVGTDGIANLDALVRGATMSSGSTALLGGTGTALIIHANDDDQMTDPEGNSGDRVACGVILPADPTAASATAQSRSPGGVTTSPAQLPYTPVSKPAGAVTPQPGSAAQPAVPNAAQPTTQRPPDSSSPITSPLLIAGLGVLLLAAGYLFRRQRRG